MARYTFIQSASLRGERSEVRVRPRISRRYRYDSLVAPLRLLHVTRVLDGFDVLFFLARDNGQCV